MLTIMDSLILKHSHDLGWRPNRRLRAIGAFRNAAAAALLGTLAAWSVPTLADDPKGILSVREMDKDKHPHDLDAKSTIVDADSELIITVNRGKLQDAIREKNPQSPAVHALVERARLLRDTATDGLKLLPQLQSVMTPWLNNPNNPNMLGLDPQFQEVNRKVSALQVKILREVVSRSAPPTQQLFDTSLAQAAAVQGVVQKQMAIARAVFQTAMTAARDLDREIEDAARKDAVLIQMGAFIAGKQKHLPGWDDYPNDPRTVIGTRTLVLSDADRQALAKLSETAEGLNKELGTKEISEVLLQELQKVADTMKAQLRQYLQAPPCVQTVKDAAIGVKTTFDMDSAAVGAASQTAKENIEASVKAVTDSIASLDNLLANLRDRYVTGAGAAGMTPSAFLVAANTDLSMLATSVQAVVDGLGSQAGTIRSTLEGLPNTLTANLKLPKAVRDLVTTIGDCGQKLKTQANGLLANAREMLDSFLFGQRTGNALAEFGEKTLKLEAAKVPETTRFDLQNAGRASGDPLQIKVAFVKEGETSTELATRDYLLYPVSWRIDTAVGIIFANNSSKFQAAPSYSWLYKKGSRRSALYNQLFDLGVGINVSTLDFNHDDTPELGIAFSVAALKNFVQIGYGFNVQQRVPYAFFGIKLPFSR
jgi:hypothetical protein